MKILLSRAVIAAGILMLAVIPASANLITNGSFEADIFDANGLYELGLSGNDVTGWFIPNSDGTYPWGLQNGAFGATTPYGNQFFVLGRWDSGIEYTIQQTMNGLIPGATYNLSFAIASESGCCSEAEVSFLNGSLTPTQNFFAGNSGQYWTDWTTFGMNFVATSNAVTLQFKNVNPTFDNGIDLGLDNVVVELVQGVPEPATLLLLGGGLAAIAAFRRKSRV